MNDTPTTPDPIEIAMEAEASGVAPAGVAATLLTNQNRLVLRQIASENAGFVLKVLTGLAAIAAAAVLGAMAWHAAKADGVVIDPFSTPADLAAQGSTGEALAAAVQDRLARIQAETVTSFALSNVREPPVATARIVIPQTGVSIAELNQALVDALGHETHIRGEVARVPSGPEAGALALRVRVPGAGAVRLVQPDGDLEALVDRAAEQVYARLQPVNHLRWLDQHGRTAEAIELARTRVQRTQGRERAAALGMLERFLGVSVPVSESRRMQGEVARLSGVSANGNLAVSEYYLGHWETAYQTWAGLATHPEQPPGATATSMRLNDLLNRGNRDGMLGDVGQRLAHLCAVYGIAPCTTRDVVDAATTGGVSSNTDANYNDRLARLAASLSRGHDTGLAARLIAAPRPSMEGRSESYRAEIDGVWRAASGALSFAREQWPALLVVAEESKSAAARWPGLATPAAPSYFRPIALAHLGRMGEATALVAASPLDCYPCLRMRALVAAVAGDAAGADRWFAEAVRQGPSLPWAQAEWAAEKLKRGDAPGALALARQARKLAPKFPDAAEFEAEALLAQGDAKAAAAFAEAARLAPQWGRVHLKWGQALAREGKRAEAQARYRAAAPMDLTPAERAELSRFAR